MGCHLNVVLRNLELAFLPVGIVMDSFGTNSVPCVDLIDVHRSVSELQCEAIASLPPLSLWVQNVHGSVLVEVVAFARTLCNLDSPESALTEINTGVWANICIRVVVPGVKLNLEHWSCRSVNHGDQELCCISSTLSLEVSGQTKEGWACDSVAGLVGYAHVERVTRLVEPLLAGIFDSSVNCAVKVP